MNAANLTYQNWCKKLPQYRKSVWNPLPSFPHFEVFIAYHKGTRHYKLPFQTQSIALPWSHNGQFHCSRRDDLVKIFHCILLICVTSKEWLIGHSFCFIRGNLVQSTLIFFTARTLFQGYSTNVFFANSKETSFLTLNESDVFFLLTSHRGQSNAAFLPETELTATWPVDCILVTWQWIFQLYKAIRPSNELPHEMLIKFVVMFLHIYSA